MSLFTYSFQIPVVGIDEMFDNELYWVPWEPANPVVDPGETAKKYSVSTNQIVVLLGYLEDGRIAEAAIFNNGIERFSSSHIVTMWAIEEVVAEILIERGREHAAKREFFASHRKIETRW